MHPDAGHGGKRPKRCLPAKLHERPAHYDANAEEPAENPMAESCFRHPQVAMTINHRAKQRQLTVFYRLLPHLRRNRAND